MTSPRIAAIAAVAVATGFAAAASAASTSHAKFWENPTGKVSCGIMIHPANKPATEVLCGARVIPAPPHVNAHEGDPGFVQLAKTGRPRLLRLSQDSYIGNMPTRLSRGTTWTSLGVTCTVAAKSVTCTNQAGHGFEVYGSKPYRSF
jgi:hypothetical protein